MDTHDLRSPIVLLRDEAITICLDEQGPVPSPAPKPRLIGREPTADDFLSYVNDLLAQKEDTTHLAILSPTINNSKRLSIYDDPPPVGPRRIAISMASRESGGGSSYMERRFEFSETITPSVALRSAYSILRATRKVYIQH